MVVQTTSGRQYEGKRHVNARVNGIPQQIHTHTPHPPFCCLIDVFVATCDDVLLAIVE